MSTAIHELKCSASSQRNVIHWLNTNMTEKLWRSFRFSGKTYEFQESLLNGPTLDLWYVATDGSKLCIGGVNNHAIVEDAGVSGIAHPIHIIHRNGLPEDIDWWGTFALKHLGKKAVIVE